MMSTLSIRSSSDSCAAAVDTCANINPAEGRIGAGSLVVRRARIDRLNRIPEI